LVSFGSVQVTDAPYPAIREQGRSYTFAENHLNKAQKKSKGALTMIQAMTCRKKSRKVQSCRNVVGLDASKLKRLSVAFPLGVSISWGIECPIGWPYECDGNHRAILTIRDWH
jgi:hypothetical protein